MGLLRIYQLNYQYQLDKEHVVLQVTMYLMHFQLHHDLHELLSGFYHPDYGRPGTGDEIYWNNDGFGKILSFGDWIARNKEFQDFLLSGAKTEPYTIILLDKFDLDSRLNFIFALDLRGASSRRGSTRSRGHVDGAAVLMRRVLEVQRRRLRTNRSSISCVLTTASLKYVMSPMSAVFHLFAIFVKVVDPDDMSTWRTLFSKVRKDCSSTCAARRGDVASRRRRHDDHVDSRGITTTASRRRCLVTTPSPRPLSL